MKHEYVSIEGSVPLQGTCDLIGAKNAVLVIMASLILTSGKSRLNNVPFSEDVMRMIELLTDLGARVVADFERNSLEIDTSSIHGYEVSPAIMGQMRASILVMGPLLARFSKARIALPGGCSIGARPIDYHLRSFSQMGASIDCVGQYVNAQVLQLRSGKFILEYPSVGATENLLMAATLIAGTTRIINAALEPEVLDLIDVLKKMGARITIGYPQYIEIEGVSSLQPIEHTIIYDRLEAGSLLLAAAITGGEITLPQAPVDSLEVFLLKLQEMGHTITTGVDRVGVHLKATRSPKAVSFKTMPYPGFPTDLQAQFMAALCVAEGRSIITETVYENRLLHVDELRKMGARITIDGQTAVIDGVERLQAAHVEAKDIRGSCALVLAGLAAEGKTQMHGIHHLKRGYQNIVGKLSRLGAKIALL